MTNKPISNGKPSSAGLSWWVILLGIALVIALAVFPLLTIQDSEFGGADGAGADLIAQIAPDYNAEWIAPLWSPPGGETESLLFALQAAIGGALIGYVLGVYRGRKSQSHDDR